MPRIQAEVTVIGTGLGDPQRLAKRVQRHLEAGRPPEQAVARAMGGRIVQPPRPDVDPLRLVAAIFRDRGMSYSAIGRSYGISPSTARSWVETGRKALAEDPAGSRRHLVAAFGEEFAARYLDDPAPDGPEAA